MTTLTTLLMLLLAATAPHHPDAAKPRVAALLPLVADALDRVGGAEVVASVRRQATTPPAPPLVDLGSPHAPSFERLADAQPSLVIGERALHGAIADRLGRGGAEVVLIDTSSVDGTLAGLTDVGRHAGVGPAMDAAVARTRGAIDAMAVTTHPRVLIVFGAPGAQMVVTDRTWLGDLAHRLRIENLGGTVAGAERHPGYVEVSDEVLGEMRPDLVLLVTHGDPTAIRETFMKRITTLDLWPQLDRTRGVAVLPPDLFAANPGLDLDVAATRLRALVDAVPPARP